MSLVFFGADFILFMRLVLFFASFLVGSGTLSFGSGGGKSDELVSLGGMIGCGMPERLSSEEVGLLAALVSESGTGDSDGLLRFCSLSSSAMFVPFVECLCGVCIDKNSYRPGEIGYNKDNYRQVVNEQDRAVHYRIVYVGYICR